MNKTELIEEASSKVGLTEKDIGNVVDKEACRKKGLF